MILSLLYNRVASVTAPSRKTNIMISHHRENFKSNISYGKIYHCRTYNNTWKISSVKILNLTFHTEKFIIAAYTITHGKLFLFHDCHIFRNFCLMFIL